MGYDPRQDPAVNCQRTMPKVPGYNAQPLQPSIGIDGWNGTGDSSRGQTPFAGSQHCKRFGVRPTHGKIEGAECSPEEIRDMAIAYAEKLAKGGSEKRAIEWAASDDAETRVLAWHAVTRLGGGQDKRKHELAGVLLEILNP